MVTRGKLNKATAIKKVLREGQLVLNDPDSFNQQQFNFRDTHLKFFFKTEIKL